MSGRAIHILAVMMAVVSFVSCRRVRTGHELGRIESELRSGNADSAALMLSRMERNRMPKAQAARFTVLNAMAADKLNIDDGSLLPSLDSLSEWYVTHGRKRDRMLFWYYYGDQCMDSEQQDNAMIPFLRCLDIARKSRDWFYAGMASREVSVIYKSYFDSKSELEYISQSEEYFRKADARIHYINALYLKAQSLYNRGMIEESSSAYKQVISIAEESSDTVMLGKALMYFAGNYLIGSSANPEEAYKLFTKAAELNAEFHVESLARYAYAARKTGHCTESLALISEARSKAETPYEKNLVEFYSSKMDLAVGPEEYQSMLVYLDSVAQKATLNSPLRSLNIYTIENSRIKQSRMRLTIALCITLIVILILTFVLVSMNRKSRWNRSMLEYQCLLADLKTKLSESDKYSASSDESFMSFLERMQSVFDELYRGVEGNTVQSLKDMLDGIKADSFLGGRLREVFSRQHPDHLSKMVSSGRFTEDEIDLYVMTCLGMSYFTIALLLGVSFNAVCIRVSRLRSKISTAVSGADAEFLISLIPWRRNY